MTDPKNLMNHPDYSAWQEEMLEIIQLFHQRGWSPATSTNYSFRNPSPAQDTFTISRSGVDKLHFQASDFMVVDQQGEPLEGYQDKKPSAETLLHTMLYKAMHTHSVLHTHSPGSTVFSMVHRGQRRIKITGFEVLKGLAGITSHEAVIYVPNFENSQDIPTLSEEIRHYAENNPDMKGFLLAGHGLYAWGNSPAEAKRHVEVLEFIFECLNQMYGLCRQPEV